MKSKSTSIARSEMNIPDTAQLLAALAEQIRAWRGRHSLTQADLAVKSGISVSFISMIERAERSPSYETLYAIAAALELPVSELFRAEEEPAVDDGYYRKLIDFARGAHLSRRQVEQMIAVGRAMYELPDVASTPERVPASRRCSVQGCNRPLLAKGLCPSHYRQKLRHQKSR